MLPMRSQQSPLERRVVDNVAREQRLLRDHPSWKIERHKPENWPTEPITFEATDEVVTLRSTDLGALLDLVERAMQDGD